MLRNAIVRAARTLAVPRAATPAFKTAVRPAISVNKPAFVFSAVRAYSAGASLSKVEVENRILDLLKGFDKISDPTKLTPTAHFSADLGLDSLDAVEVVMAIEEEFNVEIPDKDADNILSVEQAVNYVLAQPDAH